MTENIAVLGSTGSIGLNTLDVVSRLNGKFKVIGLAADSNIDLLSQQASSFKAKIVSVGNEQLRAKIRPLLSSSTKTVCGQEGLVEIVSRPDVETVVFAISGNTCLVPLMEAIRCKKRIALANKEALVSAGPAIIEAARNNRVRIIPIDSEHSAIFQCLDGRGEDAAKIYLTGSGGPLLNVPRNRIDKMPRRFMLRHPKWKMGPKISVDSATMMNKGLEILEAQYLFNVDESTIEVLIHPEAIVHSMVEFADGTVMAQLGVPDMRLPIQYALTYPKRLASACKAIDFSKTAALTFKKPDQGKFPCLGLARAAARHGGTAPAVLCASDEEAVRAYLEDRIRFSDISRIIEKVLSRHKNSVKTAPAICEVLEAGEWAKQEVASLCYH